MRNVGHTGSRAQRSPRKETTARSLHTCASGAPAVTPTHTQPPAELACGQKARGFPGQTSWRATSFPGGQGGRAGLPVRGEWAAGEEGALPGLPRPIPCLARRWAGDARSRHRYVSQGHIRRAGTRWSRGPPASPGRPAPTSPGRPAPGRLSSRSNLPSCATGREGTAEGCWGHPGTPGLVCTIRSAAQGPQMTAGWRPQQAEASLTPPHPTPPHTSRI